MLHILSYLTEIKNAKDLYITYNPSLSHTHTHTIHCEIE